jgi:hypothetical protein
LRALATAFALTVSGTASAETLHYALSAGAGLAHGIGGFKLELRYGPAAVFGSVGLGPRPAAGIRYYFADRQSGAGFISLEYARYNESYYDRTCCEYYDNTEHGFGAVLGYRFRFAPGFFELGIGPAWTLHHDRGYPAIGAPYDRKDVAFGMSGLTAAVPDIDVALGLEF